MAPNPGAIAARINDTIAAWEEHAPQAMFSGLTLAQYKTRVKPSLDARTTISDLQLQLNGARVARDNADVESSDVTLSVASSVKGDPNFGENSAFYSALGYVRKDDRRSGLTRVSNPETPAAPVTAKISA